MKLQILPSTLDLLGALIAASFYALTIMVFLARMSGRPQVEYWTGLVMMLLILPLLFLLVKALGMKRDILYCIQIGLGIVWLVMELCLDYILKIDFRHVRWMIIPYVMVFFAAGGGLIGVASRAGRGWTIASVILFLIMAVLAFVQHSVTGM